MTTVKTTCERQGRGNNANVEISVIRNVECGVGSEAGGGDHETEGEYERSSSRQDQPLEIESAGGHGPSCETNAAESACASASRTHQQALLEPLNGDAAREHLADGGCQQQIVFWTKD